MKILAIALLSIEMILFAGVGNAQVVPQPPTPPSQSQSETSTSYSKTTHSVNNQEKVSISISNSDDSYMLRAKFPVERNKDIEEVLMKEMNISKMRFEQEKQIWSSNSHGEEVYEIILSPKKLSIFLDKRIASSGLVDKFDRLGIILRQVISGAEDDRRQEADRMQREADRMRAEADRMQREADRLKKDAELSGPDRAQRYRDDATKIREEIDRMTDEISDLSTEASRKGGVSPIIKQILGEDKTYIGTTFKSSRFWTWPAAQRDLLSALLKDGIIDSENDISMTTDDTGAYVNGKKLSSHQLDKYMRIFSAHKLRMREGFSFYKKHDHIVLITSNANMEGFIEDMVSRGYISSQRAKVKLKINGSSLYKNGVKVSGSELMGFNELMLKNNIIPVPGKTFEIIKLGSYKLGYSVGDKTHIGTWRF